MNKKRLFAILLLILGVIFVAVGIVLENKETINEPAVSPTSNPTSPPSDSSHMNSDKSERQIELETELEEVIVNYLKEIYGNTYPTEDTLKDNPNGISMGVTLREFKEKYGQDISMFHTDEISCDEDYTTGIFRYDTTGPSYEASLICEYIGVSQ